MFRFLRITFLLLVLLAVALMTWHDGFRNTRWNVPLYVAIYPIAADPSPITQAYVNSLHSEVFQPIDRFFEREAAAAAGARRRHPLDHPLEPETALVGLAGERPCARA